MARLSAVTYACILVVAVGVLYVTSQPGLRGGTEVKAEFQDVYPLLTGMNVREWGAPAGTVSGIDLTDRGTVMVTMQLNAGTTPPRTDATASIREQDITGDSYVDLSPGNAAKPLGGTVIPTSRTLRAPRFDDLLNSFNKPVQQSLQILLDQLGMAVQGRGEDLNRAALRLRPALDAADQAAREVASQNATLRSLIGNTEQVTAQLAAGSDDLAKLIDSLATTTQTTAAHADSLDQALALAPRTAARPRDALTAPWAGRRRPLACTLAGAARGLARTARLLGPFVDDGAAVLGEVAPTLVLTRKLFVASKPTLRAAPKRVFTAPFDVAGGTGKLLSTLLGQKDIVKSLFGADGYGRSPQNKHDVGLGAVGVERGNQQGYPANYDRKRFFLRAAAVLSCETFGLRIQPGSLRRFWEGACPRRRPAAGEPGARDLQALRAGLGRLQPPTPRGLRHRLHDLLGGIHVPHVAGGLGQAHRPKPNLRGLRDILDLVLGP